MGIIDIFLALLILAGAVYVLYRSLFKKKGLCHECSGCSCKTKDKILL